MLGKVGAFEGAAFSGDFSSLGSPSWVVASLDLSSEELTASLELSSEGVAVVSLLSSSSKSLLRTILLFISAFLSVACSLVWAGAARVLQWYLTAFAELVIVSVTSFTRGSTAEAILLKRSSIPDPLKTILDVSVVCSFLFTSRSGWLIFCSEACLAAPSLVFSPAWVDGCTGFPVLVLSVACAENESSLRL